MKEFDTIAAVATSMGESGISIIRVSGSRSLNIVSDIFIGINGKKLNDIKTYTMRYGHIVEKNTNEIIDEVIVSYMKGPRSFTAEDTVEVNCHGGVISVRRILDSIIRNGARIAEPGEFTKRAFLNGRIDLSQAEAVIDIIRAKTELSMKSALIQSGGKLSNEILLLRNKLLGIIAHIEATVDYPEDDMEEVTADKTSLELVDIIDLIDKLLESAEEGKIIREGLSTVIVGKPNVGKSSLLNALTNENRAIVTDIPGTTRDIIEEFISLDGIPIKIIDTAGIRETNDVVEKIGVERSKEKIEEADLIIFMIDSSISLEDEDYEIIKFIKDKKYIILLNKTDLDSKISLNDFSDLKSDNIIKISAKELSGIDDLKSAIKDLFFKGEIKAQDLLITNSRHKEVLYRAKESLIYAKEALRDTLAIDLASIDIRNAWRSLGEINGDTIDEDLIDKIFSEFCLGK